MYTPDLSPGVKIPGLPAVAQARLHMLVAKMIDANPKYSWILNDRKSRELNAIQRLNISARSLECNHLRTLAAAASNEQSRINIRQAAYRCQFVADVLALRQMGLVRIKHARALARELVLLKKRISGMPDDSPLVALYVNLSVLVSRFGSGKPDDALQYMQHVPELPERYALQSIKTSFEEIAANPRVESQDFVTLDILVQFIENDDARGVELELLKAVRVARSARYACLDLNLARSDSLATERAQLCAQLEKAVRAEDHKGIDRIKQEVYETEIGFAARGSDLIVLTDKLQRARSRLEDALAAACKDASTQYGLWIDDIGGVALLTSVINCISAHSLLQQIVHDLPTFQGKVLNLDQAPRGMRDIAGAILDRVLSSPAVR